jgi:thiamine-monophosphate kinase
VLQGDLPGLDSASAGFLVDRYRLPRPRVALGPHLIGIATAALDVSDGLVADLRHICEVSNLAAIIDAPCVPLSAAARFAIAANPALFQTVLTGGDDYEILFTASPAAVDEIAALSRSLGVPIMPIGHMVMSSERDQSPVAVLDDAGLPLALASEGWTHFGIPPK